MSSRPAPGTYYLVDRVLSPKGEKLAITFNGVDKDATAMQFSGSTKQQVNIGIHYAIQSSLTDQL